MRDFRDAKAMVRTLRQVLAAKGVRLSNSETLELVAKMLGERDWNTLAAAIQVPPDAPAPPPAPSEAPRRPGPTLFSSGLEGSLHRAVGFATQRKHAYTTVEHLLLALIEDSAALATLQACAADVPALGRALTEYVDVELNSLIFEKREEPEPTAGFHRVIQRAVIHVNSSGRNEVTGANVLVAIFSERESRACTLLHEHGVDRVDAVNFIAHGVRKDGGKAA